MNIFRRNLKRVDTQETASAYEQSQLTALAFGLRQFGTPHPDEIARQRGRGIYQDMVDTDPQVKLSVRFKQLATLAPGWDILPYNDEPINEETAEFVHDTLTNLKVSMDLVLLSVLDGLVDGFSVSELVYERIRSGEWEGRIGLNRIVGKPPETFDFETDDNGNLEDKGLVQFSKDAAKRRELDPNKFLIWSYQKRGANFYGKSDLRPAFPFWFSKRAHDSSWNYYLERFAQPIPVGTYADNTSNNERTAFENVLKFLHQKTSLVFKKDKYDIRFLEQAPGAQNFRGFETRQKYNDIQISRALLIPDLVLSEGTRVGSKALGEVHGQAFTSVLEQLGSEISQAVTAQVVRRLVLYNFDVTNFPKFFIRPYSQQAEQQIAAVLADMIDANVIDADEAFIRERLGFPPKQVEKQEVAPSTEDESPNEGEE